MTYLLTYVYKYLDKAKKSVHNRVSNDLGIQNTKNNESESV